MAKEYIEREAVRNELYDADAITMSGVALLNSIPAADVVEVRHGEWVEQIETPNWLDDDVEVYYKCSICGCYNWGESAHCPNCGAKMDGKGDDK